MERITAYVRSDFRYITVDRRQAMRRSGRVMFNTINQKLAAAGVDFAPTIAAFEQAFNEPEPSPN